MSNQPHMVCAECKREIRLGEEYIAYVRHVEVAKRPGPLGRLRGHGAAITVMNAADERIVHVGCDNSGGAR